jgi:hypothetical protein
MPGQTITEEIIAPEQKPADERVEKARRLSRTIINDIYLYNTAKLEEALKTNSVFSVFASDLKEGQKLYETRIPQEGRDMGDFFNEEIEKFISNKKQNLG